MKDIRITENDLIKIVKELNAYESAVNPHESGKYNGKLWDVDYFANYGVYIRRGYKNILPTNKRVKPIEAYLYLLGVRDTLKIRLEHCRTSDE